MVLEPQIWIAGLAVGVLVGMTGMGGGSLMTPMLIFLFGVRPVVAVGTDLAATAITKIFGSWQHYRQGTVDLSIVKYLAVGSIPGALVGVGLLKLLENLYGDGLDHVVTTALGVILVVMAGVMLWRTLIARNKPDSASPIFHLHGHTKTVLPVIGFLVGIAVGITSVGSGALVIVALALFFPLSAGKLVGTDVFHASLLVGTAALAHLTVGYIDFNLMGNLLVGSLPGVYIGSRLSVKVPDKALRATVAVVLLGSGLRLV